MVFDFIFYCVTMHTLYSITFYSVEPNFVDFGIVVFVLNLVPWSEKW